jgi:lysozyme family protein
MAADNFAPCLKFVLQFEGGFVNHPKDPGGATNLGVTIGTLSRFLGHPATVHDVQNLTPKTVEPIYRRFFWDKVGGDDLPMGLDLAVFDFGVHSGPSRGIIGLQRVLGLADDGQMGPVTITTAKRADPMLAVQRLCAARLAFLSQLTVFKTFGKGLKSRVSKCENAALSMIARQVVAMASVALSGEQSGEATLGDEPILVPNGPDIEADGRLLNVGIAVA